ncbi:MAG: cbb3-type cytochrome c oxidase subunit 3 [Oligoflexia bacterium]|nr:cbb3-type cytochrome c oxidase subunit 3 [Oligoflexia bacterium]
MKSQVLSSFAWTDLTVLAFIIFLTFFVAMIYWVFRKGSKNLYKSVEQLPLEEAPVVRGEA